MANWSDQNSGLQGQAQGRLDAGARDVAFDAGLRSYMLKVYNYMASGILLTGVVAMLFARGGIESPAATIIMAGGLLSWVIM
ncbi:MAG: BAX inhibitor (BI)-1/YccA family protein, partial [Parasphingopyxis sp.]